MKWGYMFEVVYRPDKDNLLKGTSFNYKKLYRKNMGRFAAVKKAMKRMAKCNKECIKIHAEIRKQGQDLYGVKVSR